MAAPAVHPIAAADDEALDLVVEVARQRKPAADGVRVAQDLEHPLRRSVDVLGSGVGIAAMVAMRELAHGGGDACETRLLPVHGSATVEDGPGDQPCAWR